MADIFDRMPKQGEVWRHTKTGGLYVIEGASFNSVTDKVDVLYKPVEACEFSFFTRQMLGHEKAFLSQNEDGQPRFQRVAYDYRKWLLSQAGA